MRDKVLRFIEENGLLEKGDKVIVALSGGADSVSLLHALISVKEIYNLSIYAAHFNHMIRDAEAERDEQFCIELCGRLRVPLYITHADVPYFAERCGESLELCGRRLRYEFLYRTAGELGGAKIATAHNLNDNTETVLMNLIRGSGIAGLGGIPLRRGSIIRPLLSCSREEIESYCAENGLEYVTDSTNLSDEYTRNKLRLNVLPILRGMNPSLDEGVMRMAKLMREADGYLDKISLEELNNCKTEYGYCCEALLRLDSTVLNYAVKHILEEAGAPCDSRHIDLVVEKMRDGGCVDLGRGFRADCSQGTLRVIDLKAIPDGDFCIPAADFCHERLSLSRVRMTAVADENGTVRIVNREFLSNCIPCELITDETVARHRRAGDTFTDPRRGVTKTLKKLFNELKIPREKRGSIRVVAAGSTVLWIEGIGVSKQARIPDDFEGDVYYLDLGSNNQ